LGFSLAFQRWRAGQARFLFVARQSTAFAALLMPPVLFCRLLLLFSVTARCPRACLTLLISGEFRGRGRDRCKGKLRRRQESIIRSLTLNRGTATMNPALETASLEEVRYCRFRTGGSDTLMFLGL
jgi:hypothetical protein